MGVFTGGMNMPEMSVGQKQLCKRNYEADIEDVSKKVTLSSRLLLAVEDYCDSFYSDGNANFTLNGLIGGLTREIKSLNKSRDLLIAEWEKEKA